MGGLPKIPIVAVGEDGGCIGYYESISEAASVTGMYRRGITESLRTGKPYLGVKWARESDYRALWLEGRTGELAFSCRQMRSDEARKKWRNLTKEQRESRRANLSRARKALSREHPEVMEPSRESHRQPVCCINTGECFGSVVEYSRAYGLNPASVRTNLCRGIRTKGYIIKKITKEEYQEFQKHGKRRNQKDTGSHPV